MWAPAVKRTRVTGKQLQATIIELARMYGWVVAHFPSVPTNWGGYITPVAADGKGWPDLVLVRERVVFVEVKGHGDRLKPEQKQWQEWLRAAGAETYVWTAKELDSGEIAATLQEHVAA